MDMKTTRNKPRSIALSNFGKERSRDDLLLNTNDAYANVKLENTREERELEIEAKKESQKKYLDIGML